MVFVFTAHLIFELEKFTFAFKGIEQFTFVYIKSPTNPFSRQFSNKVFHLPIVYCLGEPPQDRVPVGKVGLLLGHISLTVGQHISQIRHKMVGLLLKDFLIKVAQVNQVAYCT